MKQTQEFERRLQALFADSLTCAVSAYTQFTFDHLAGTNVDLLDRLHPHGDFWNRVMGGLQASAFAALGRIYESKSDTYNALELIRFADKHPGIFRSAALEARKVAAGVMPSAARRYAQEAFKLPRRGGLSRLRTALDEKRRFYQKKVAPIRHQVFAHAGKLDREDRHRLFTPLGMRELEDLVVFPLRLHRALFDLYQNGREPLLDVVPSHTFDVVKAIPADGVSTWEHLHAAKDTREFLTWLGTASLAEMSSSGG